MRAYIAISIWRITSSIIKAQRRSVEPNNRSVEVVWSASVAYYKACGIWRRRRRRQQRAVHELLSGGEVR